MAVNLGTGFLEVHPVWKKLNRRSVQRHLDKLDTKLDVGVDEKKFNTKVDGLIKKLQRPVEMKIETGKLVKQLDQASKKADKIGQELEKGFKDAQVELSKLTRMQGQADEARKRALEKRDAATRRVKTAEMNLYEISKKDTRTRTQKLRAQEQLKNAQDAELRAGRELQRASRETLGLKQDILAAEEKVARAAEANERHQSRVEAQMRAQRRLANNPIVTRVMTKFDKTPYAPLVRSASKAGTSAGAQFVASMNAKIAASGAGKGAAASGIMGGGIASQTRDFVRGVAPMAGAYGVARGVGGSFKLASDYEFQLSAIKAVSAASKTEMQQISDLAMKLGADTKYTTLESAAALEELVKAGLPIEDIVRGVGEATVDLAAAGDVAVERAAEISANLKNTFGLKTSEMAHVMDTISGAANFSSIDVEQFAESMQMFGTVAKQGGMSVEDAAIAIAEMGNQGIKGSDAGTSLKTFMVNMDPTTTRAQNVMEQYGLMGLREKDAKAALAQDGIAGVDTSSMSAMINSLGAFYKKRDGVTKAVGKEQARKYMQENQLFDSAFYGKEGNFLGLRNAQVKMSGALGNLSDQERIQASKQIFGTDAMRASGMMMGNGGAKYDEMKKGVYSTTAKQTAETRQGNFKSSMEQLGGSVENVRIKALLGMMPVLTTAARVATRAVNGLGEKGPEVTKFFDDLAKRFPDAGKHMKVIGTGLAVIGKGLYHAFTEVGVPAFELLSSIALDVVLPAFAEVFGFIGRHGKATEGVLTAVAVMLIPWATKMVVVKSAMVAWSVASKGLQAVMFVLRSALLGVKAAAWLLNAVMGATKWAWIIGRWIAHQAVVVASTTSLWLYHAAQKALNLVISAAKWVWSTGVMLAHKGAQVVTTATSWLLHAAMVAINWAVAGAKWVWNTGVMLAHKGAQVITTGASWLLQAAIVAVNFAVGGAKWVWATGVMIAHKAAQAIVTGATWLMVAAQKALNLVMRMNPIGLVVTALVLLGIWLVKTYKTNETFRNKVNGAWTSVKNKAKDSWEWIRDKVLKPFGNFMKTTLPAKARAFRDEFGTAWDGVRAKAAVPINWVINRVWNNGLRVALGKIPGLKEEFGGENGKATPIKVPGKLSGGVIPGVFNPNNRDNVLGVDGRGRPTVKVEPGEMVVNRHQTKKHFGLLQRINAGMDLPGLKGGGVVQPVPGHGNRHGSGYPWATWAGDFPVPMGTPIKAWKDGIVASVQQLMKNGHFVSYGRVTRINHTDGTSSLYAHQSAQNVAGGQQVTAGQVIGRVGSTGNSSGPHLHFETKGGAFAMTGGGPSGDGDSMVDYLNPFKAAVGTLRKSLSALDGLGSWGSDVAKPAANGAIDAGLSAGEKAAKSAAMAVVNSNPFTRDMMNKYKDKDLTGMAADMVRSRWGQENNDAMVKAAFEIIAHESAWNPRADNPNSTAYGLFQLLYRPGTRTPYDQTDPKLQMVDGFNYISGRYGNPVKAWEFWQRHNWYAKGTMSALPGMARIDERGDEWINFNGGERVMPHGQEPKWSQQVLVGSMRITNWDEGLAEFRGELRDEMDWRGTR